MWTPWIVSPAHPTAWAPPPRGPRRWLIDVLLRVSALLVRTAVRVQRAPLLTPVPAGPQARTLHLRPPQAPTASAKGPWHTPQAVVVTRHADFFAEPAATAQRGPWPEREFHAEAGAPEGALFVDGQFIGRLPGVTRL